MAQTGNDLLSPAAVAATLERMGQIEWESEHNPDHRQKTAWLAEAAQLLGDYSGFSTQEAHKVLAAVSRGCFEMSLSDKHPEVSSIIDHLVAETTKLEKAS